MKLADLVYSRAPTSEIVDMLGWAEGVTISDLVGALMLAFKRIDDLEHQVARLSPSRVAAEAEADQAAADLAGEKLGPDPSYLNED